MAGDTTPATTRVTRTPRERATDAFDVELRKYGKAHTRAETLRTQLAAVEAAETQLRARVEFLANDPLLDPDLVGKALAANGIETTAGTIDEAIAATPRVAGDRVASGDAGLDPLPGS